MTGGRPLEAQGAQTLETREEGSLEPAMVRDGPSELAAEVVVPGGDSGSRVSEFTPSASQSLSEIRVKKPRVIHSILTPPYYI